jgi:IK cytokine
LFPFSENDAKQYVESVHGSLSEDSVPKFLSKLAEEIYSTAIIRAKQPPPLKNDMFQAGRMAFLWHLDDTKTPSGMDPNVPTTIIRSLSEVKDDVSDLLFYSVYSF